jgi:hypothetical protein
MKTNFLSYHFYLTTNFTKLKIYFSFELLKKKIWANFQRMIELFTQKIVTKLSKIWVWDPGSGKTYSGSRIPDLGVKKARIPDPDPRHCRYPVGTGTYCLNTKPSSSFQILEGLYAQNIPAANPKSVKLESTVAI